MILYTLKDIRQELNLTQSQMAEIGEMSVNTYIFKEKKNKFYFHEVYKFCEKLGIDIRGINPVERKKGGE